MSENRVKNITERRQTAVVKFKKKAKNTDQVLGKSVRLKELRQGGGIAHFTQETLSEKNKTVLSQKRILLENDGGETLWMWKVSILFRKTEQKARDAPPVFPDAHGPTGWTWSSFPGLRSCGAAAAPHPLYTAFTPLLVAFVL
ncbi:hypothetical protein ILYODFUR_031924 [Ilyodon furcidens]|uniref:Uncharacterized protein n=1 Tax=Ilyodon furcidens TaxID=33524 RepID=A0ABV0SRW0_9TELE